MMAGLFFMLTTANFLFYFQAIRRKSDTTHQDVALFRGVSLPLAKKSKAGATALYLSRCDFKKRIANAAAFIQEK